MKVGTITQQPNERLSYSVDYAEALTDGDNLSTASVTASPPGLTVDNVGVYGTRVRLWVSGGLNLVTYKITLGVDTADGRRFEDELTVKIKEV